MVCLVNGSIKNPAVIFVLYLDVKKIANLSSLSEHQYANSSILAWFCGRICVGLIVERNREGI